MMESVIQENTIHFKEFEKKIFRFVCELGQEIFEEMDGIWLKMQGKAHEKAKKYEMKVFYNV